MGTLKPTERQIEALVRLRGNPDFVQFQILLEDYEKELTEYCLIARDTVSVAQAQGGVTALRTLRQAYHLAPQQLDKLTTNKRNTP